MFYKNKNIAVVYGNETGVEKEQRIHREKFDYIFLTEDFMGIPAMLTIGNKQSRKAILTLKGKKAFLGCFYSFSRINRILYSNRKKSVEARPLYLDDINLVKKYENAVKFPYSTWIYDVYMRKITNKNREDDSQCNYGIRYVKEMQIYDRLLSVNRKGNEFANYDSMDYCPVIQFKDTKKILVDIKSMQKYGKWKLFPNNKLLKFFYSIF